MIHLQVIIFEKHPPFSSTNNPFSSSNNSALGSNNFGSNFRESNGSNKQRDGVKEFVNNILRGQGSGKSMSAEDVRNVVQELAKRLNERNQQELGSNKMDAIMKMASTYGMDENYIPSSNDKLHLFNQFKPKESSSQIDRQLESYANNMNQLIKQQGGKISPQTAMQNIASSMLS